jgi:2,4-dienoyl-CoA reductase-like NADH-dependent reductase (Old Yellow Enzyme family)
MADTDVLWEPIAIGNLTVPNRISVSAHGPGVYGEQYARYLAARARGGAGLIVTGATAVHPSTDVGLTWKAWQPESVAEMRLASDAVHAEGRPLVVQLFHVGVQFTGARSLDDWGLLFSPSAMPSPVYGVIPKAMERSDIKRVVEGFTLSARHVREAGADGIEIHGAHGYLLTGFLSPLTNRRDDDYGGSTENRARIVLEIAEAARRECGRDFVIGMKLNFDEFVGERGITPPEAEATLRILHASGLFDYYSISCGNYNSFHYLVAPSSSGLSGHLAEHGAMARRVVGGEVPVIVTGTIRTVERAAEIVRAGQADIAGMIRAQIADPDLVRKAQTGRSSEIRRCVGANQGCWRRLMKVGTISCTVNPVTGREGDWGSPAPRASQRQLRVVVVGGGPGGMKLAETAALRGHDVTLYERDSELGGQIRYAARLPHRAAWGHLVEDLAGSLERLGVETHLDTELTPASARALGADVIVAATGAVWNTSGFSARRPDRDGIPLGEGASVIDPIAAISTPEACGARVVIVDDNGDYLPLGLAELLAEPGRTVTLVTSQMAVGSRLGPDATVDLAWVYPRVVAAGVEVFTSAYVDRIEPGRIVLSDAWGRGTRELMVDTVVLSMQRESDDALFQALSAEGLDLRRVGDCVAPREVDDAMLEGVREGFAL